MFALFSVLMLLFLVAFIVGLIKPSLVVRWGESPTRKQVLQVYLVGFIVTFIGSVATAPEKKPLIPETAQATAEQPAKAAEPDKSEAQVKADQQKAVTKWQIDLMWLSTSMDKDLEPVFQVIQAAGQGASLTDILRAARRGEQICDQVYNKAAKIKPHGLPDPVEETCTKAKRALENAYYHGSEAFKALQEYVDSRATSAQVKWEDELGRMNALKLLALAGVEDARRAVGLPSTFELMKSPEYKAWKAYETATQQVGLQADKKFGTAPHLSFKPGTQLKLEKAMFVVPGQGACRPARLPDPKAKGIAQAVTLQPGQVVEIWGRQPGQGNSVKCFLVLWTDAQGVHAGAVNPAQLIWYDTPERTTSQLDAREAFIAPKYDALAKEHFEAKGLDKAAIEQRAIAEQWMMIWRLYDKGAK